jgi:hypothetical protein
MSLSSRPTVEDSQGVYPCWMEDVERLDEMIGRYLAVALSAEENFDRALKAAQLTLELIGIQIALLESSLGGAQ